MLATSLLASVELSFNPLFSWQCRVLRVLWPAAVSSHLAASLSRALGLVKLVMLLAAQDHCVSDLRFKPLLLAITTTTFTVKAPISVAGSSMRGIWGSPCWSPSRAAAMDITKGVRHGDYEDRNNKRLSGAMVRT
jgi:hypothetical protein